MATDTSSVWNGTTVNFDNLVGGGGYDWYNKIITVGGADYRLLHGYMVAGLSDLGSSVTAAQTASSAAVSAAAQAVPAATTATQQAAIATAAANTAAGIVQVKQPSEIAGIDPILDFPFSASTAVPSGVITGSSGKWVFNQAGALVNVASGTAPIDFDPITSVVRGLLVEESRTNLLTYSQQWDNAAWAPGSSAATVTANSTTAPDGTLTADTITDADAVNQLIRQQIVSVSNDSATRCFSVYLKQGTAAKAFLLLQYFGGTSSVTASVELDWASLTATVTGSATGGVIQASGGFIRLWIAFANNSTGNTSLTCRLSPAGASATATGTVVAWQAQVETGAFPTSPIVTTPSTVTRSGDANPISSLSSIPGWNASEGTIYVEARTALGSGTQTYAQHDDGTNNNRIAVYRDSSNVLRCIVVVSGSTVANLSLGTVANDTAFKVAFGWKANSFAASLNGAAAVTATSGAIPSGLTTHRIGHDATGNYANAPLRRDEAFPRRIAEATLALMSA